MNPDPGDFGGRGRREVQLEEEKEERGVAAASNNSFNAIALSDANEAGDDISSFSLRRLRHHFSIHFECVPTY